MQHGKKKKTNVPPENDTLDHIGWEFKTCSLKMNDYTIGFIEAMNVGEWMNVTEFESTCDYLKEALNNYERLKADNAKLSEDLKLFRDKYFSKDGNLTGSQYDEITEIIQQVENK